MNTGLFRQALAISSGTMSYLIDCTQYDVIDTVQQRFALFCLNTHDFENWVQAWNFFYEGARR